MTNYYVRETPDGADVLNRISVTISALVCTCYEVSTAQQIVNALNAQAPPAAVHSTQDCYEHFLAYSGATDHPWLKYAYFHGADVGLDRPTQAPPAAVPAGQ